jgi:hypothetical protein
MSEKAINLRVEIEQREASAKWDALTFVQEFHQRRFSQVAYEAEAERIVTDLLVIEELKRQQVFELLNWADQCAADLCRIKDVRGNC